MRDLLRCWNTVYPSYFCHTGVGRYQYCVITLLTKIMWYFVSKIMSGRKNILRAVKSVSKLLNLKQNVGNANENPKYLIFWQYLAFILSQPTKLFGVGGWGKVVMRMAPWLSMNKDGTITVCKQRYFCMLTLPLILT